MKRIYFRQQQHRSNDTPLLLPLIAVNKEKYHDSCTICNWPHMCARTTWGRRGRGAKRWAGRGKWGWGWGHVSEGVKRARQSAGVSRIFAHDFRSIGVWNALCVPSSYPVLFPACTVRATPILLIPKQSPLSRWIRLCARPASSCIRFLLFRSYSRTTATQTSSLPERCSFFDSLSPPLDYIIIDEVIIVSTVHDCL